MNRIQKLRDKAKKQKKCVVLPEGEDKRVVEAAAIVTKENFAKVCLLGKKESVEKLAKEVGVSLDGIDLIDPAAHDKKDELINAFYEKRKHKGIAPEEAKETLMKDLIFYGAMMTERGLADGFVAGACHTTSNVARAGIQCLKIDREIGTMSSCFMMELDNCPFGEEGLFAFGDCGVIPYPNSRQLAGIAIATSDMFKKLFDIEPRVGLLSYSTRGSAKGDSIENVRSALERVIAKRPGLMVDGELQLDAAIVPDVAQRKCPDSKVQGRANVLIFPNLDAGNISYKLTQRLGKARVVGPILQGLDKPCSDLSRGCTLEEIVDAVAVIAIRAQKE